MRRPSYPNRYYNVASSSLTATTTKHIFSPDGTLLATVVGASTTATTTYLHPDHLGGTNVVTDQNGEVMQTLDYYPYGSQRIATGSFSEQRRFIGEEYDGDTEFSYLNARYYQGSRGQFMSQDPVFVNLGEDERTGTILADPQLLHSYAYSRNNPLILKDEGGELAHVIIGAGGAMAGQYLYDVYNNVQANGFGASAFYRGLSSPETYAVRAAQGVAVALTGGLVGGLGLAGQTTAVAVASGATGAGGNYLLGQPVTLQSAVADALIGGATFGALKFVPGVSGAQPKFGTHKFFTGAHTLRHSQELVVGTGSTYYSNLIGGASLKTPTRTSNHNGSGGGSATPVNTFGLRGNDQVTSSNVGAFISFISQFMK